MLDRKRLRSEPDVIRAAVRNKGETVDLDRFFSLDEERRGLLQEMEELKHRRNVASQEIGRLKKEKKDAGEPIARMQEVAGRIKELEARIQEVETEEESLLAQIPNVPHSSAPVGAGERDNVVVRTWGDPGAEDPSLLPHWEIGEKLGVLDLKAGSAVTGSGFIVLRGAGARLQRALINYFLDVHREQGYQEVHVPYLVGRHSMFGTGQLPKLEEDMYAVEQEDLFLIPTAEVPVTNLLRDRTLPADELPVKYTAFSPCFRREAGAAGKDTRGLLRIHQFDKVEMVKFCAPESSYDELETLTRDAEVLLENLEIPYRVVELCTADLSFAASKCFDLETFAPAVGKWLEISSCSNFEDFQARRIGIRYRPSPGEKARFVHTLNGSGLALPRLVVTIMERFQTPTGKIRIPEVLRPYMGGLEYIQ
jgi:seryl-tRNA synthetase